MNNIDIYVYPYISKNDIQIVKIACNELNEEQSFINFHYLKTNEKVEFVDAIELSEFYKSVSYPIKSNHCLDNLITVTDIMTFNGDIEHSIGTHFSNSYRIGLISLRDESVITFLKYELMREAIQIGLQKYFEHKSDGCFFDRQTDLNNDGLCEYCENALYEHGFGFKQINELKLLLSNLRKAKLGISESNLFSVLIMDIVNYSKYTDIDQKGLIRKLQRCIRSNRFIQKHMENIIFLPTGDGCVIALSDSASKNSVKLCCELQKEVKEQDLEVRFGLNFGMIFRYRDINQHINIAGSGINMAARVMDIGDANHIIANRSVYDNMNNLDNWHRSIFHRLGVVSVKHGVELEVFNIFSEEEGYGNKELPAKMKRG